MIGASFNQALTRAGNPELRADRTTTLQVNIGKYCNQVCIHCHVDAGPHRLKEQMSDETARDVVRVLRDNPSIGTLDLTGGAPELNRVFRYLVTEARKLNLAVIDRSNLTVLHESGQQDLVEFLAAAKARVVASLPCYLQENVDRQRGGGVFEKSIQAIRMLNDAGYGREDSELILDLVFNPVGYALPPAQAALEIEYKRELENCHGVRFNRLLTITNMPIARFRQDLVHAGKLDDYMKLLADNFNPLTLTSLMCRALISVSWEGWLFDCDFNQMLGLNLAAGRSHIRDFKAFELEQRRIATGSHCFGCTAGNGSSCAGALTKSMS